MNYTVNEAVKILGFSHQAIRYQIKTNLPDSMIEYRENGAVCVTEDGLAFLRDKMGKNAIASKATEIQKTIAQMLNQILMTMIIQKGSSLSKTLCRIVKKQAQKKMLVFKN